jgi:hypothetical protein
MRTRRPARDAAHAITTPRDCVTLNVSPGLSCGVAIFQQGHYLDSGLGDRADMRSAERWISSAVFFASVLGKALVLVIEDAPPGTTPLGARALWLRAWMAAPVMKRARTSIAPEEWRRALFGDAAHSRQAELDHATRKKRAEQHARVQASASPHPSEAAAVCMGSWAAYAAPIGACLPKPRRSCA